MQGRESEWAGVCVGIPLIENEKYFSVVSVPSVESENIKFPSNVCLRILIPYSRFSRSDKMDIKEFPACVFSQQIDSGVPNISKNISFENGLGLFLNYFE